MGDDFSLDQKRWLEGYTSGAAAIRGLAGERVEKTPPPVPQPSGPDAAAALAQDRVSSAGGKLVDQEKWKRAENPLDAYGRLRDEALASTAPKPEDNFRWRFHGLFYVAPNQLSYMCRLRLPNGILTHWQFDKVAELADLYGGGYSHVTTRANLQIREIAVESGPAMVEALAEAGIIVKGSGADNIRNVTGSATAGIDPIELIDTRPHAKAWHHHILNDRSLFGLPRKFNVAFDGGGSIATLEDTNDIGFQAVEIADDAQPHTIRYRVTLGGITGHKDFARDTGVVIDPSHAVKVADAVVRVFIENGDRTNRGKARLKYLLDSWGFDKFIAAVEEKLGAALTRVDNAMVKERPRYDRLAHVGVHVQRQPGLNWIGIALPVGKMTSAQMRVLAAVARDCGDGDLRLTVWQNLIISGVPDARLEDAKAHIEACGLHWQATTVRAGLVACTGNTGCKFAAANTKGDALRIADHVDAQLTVDQPVNTHITGCHHSCAQHYIGDIGLLATKVAVGDEEQVEGYHIHVGGGFGTDASIARLIHSDVTAADAPRQVEALLRAYMSHRADEEESFHQFAGRHDDDGLRRMTIEALA